MEILHMATWFLSSFVIHILGILGQRVKKNISHRTWYRSVYRKDNSSFDTRYCHIRCFHLLSVLPERKSHLELNAPMLRPQLAGTFPWTHQWPVCCEIDPYLQQKPLSRLVLFFTFLFAGHFRLPFDWQPHNLSFRRRIDLEYFTSINNEAASFNSISWKW